MLKRDNAYVIKQQLASYLSDFKSHREVIGQDTFSYIEAGPPMAECVFFIHGAVGNKTQWRGLMQLLSRQYRVIAIDVPGLAVGHEAASGYYSLTELSNYIMRFFRHKNIESACLVAHSMGANIACRFSALYPNKVNSLVVASLTGWEQLFGQSYWHKFSEFKQLLVFNNLDEFKALFSSLFHQPPYMPDALLELRMRDLQKHQTQLYKVLTHIQQEFHLLSNDLASLTCPVLAINGVEDVFVDLSILDRVVNLYPDFKIVNFNECGHVPFLEYPKKTHSTITKFILSNGRDF
ncbi:MAG: pimeloyl-ACP methyl ester carboxylesterase [Oleispira sp.]|jgi:pimeloyl-ACP methyl ester carboxylesterase|tara:strand:- start:1024 stop:1902 length:879 start_codon:yes stop_codon:yes gene_type:complete